MSRLTLVSVIGTTPQVVTETLYALGKEGVFVDDVWIITTILGRQRVREKLCGPDSYLERMCKDYNWPELKIKTSRIVVVRDAEGKEIRDIRTKEHEQAVAETIFEKIRELKKKDPDVRIHASLAGGRKTMGYYLGTAMSLLGGKDDELSHVLVSEPFENFTSFFYPTIESQIVTEKDRTLDLKDGEVELSSIPYIRLGHILESSKMWNSENWSFGKAVNAINRELSWQKDNCTVTLVQKQQTMVLYNCVNKERVEVKLTPREFMFVHFLVDNIKGKLNNGMPYKKPTQLQSSHPEDICKEFIDILRYAPIYGYYYDKLQRELDTLFGFYMLDSLYWSNTSLSEALYDDDKYYPLEVAYFVATEAYLDFIDENRKVKNKYKLKNKLDQNYQGDDFGEIKKKKKKNLLTPADVQKNETQTTNFIKAQSGYWEENIKNIHIKLCNELGGEYAAEIFQIRESKDPSLKGVYAMSVPVDNIRIILGDDEEGNKEFEN